RSGMKSEFLLAFNEICEARSLPKEDVFEALKTALVSAYRRDANIGNSQGVRVEIDPHTGEPTIFSEKEVVDSIIDNRTEVTLERARREGNTDAEYGDLVMIDSTTASFGRIAAQTAKQVLLQRLREDEREQLYESFSGREGELVNGTVQSISGQHITIGLGRTEAILPKSQQVYGERYRAHDKVRVYVLEVRRTNRGPQIFVSRNHRNLLRRLLELEVPEIYNGQVEIKSIAREAGQRSKVAVQALQPGVDPVGACVGMRGVRIQSIVRELNDEKIDVIEWNPDQQMFIAKALSPARVSHVFLEEHPDSGKTAIVIVPDDQLSLAIGREGQNARLAAKLTGWRIDIKSLTEAASEALLNLDHPAVDTAVSQNKELIAQAEQILAKKAASRPITSEDYLTLNRVVSGIEGNIIAERAAVHEEIRRQRSEARKKVPAPAWQDPLDVLDLPGRIHNLLLDNDLETVGDVLFTFELDESIFLNFRGFGDKALEDLAGYVAKYQLAYQAVLEAEAAAQAEAEAETEVETTDESAETEVVAAESEVVEAEVEEEAEDELEPEPTAVAEEVEEEEIEPVSVLDDLSKSLIEKKPKPVKKKQPAKPSVVIARTPREEIRTADKDKKGSRKGKQLVFDENIGEVVVKRKRKGSRRSADWDEFEEEEF
ncbi:MAG: transcription termination factor NusA, partial [Anaerolineae bacterium]